jgi:uncharacterized OB-fold protein
MSDGADRFDSTSSALSKPFWDGCDEGKLLRPVCHRCGHNFFTPSQVCPKCQSDEWSYRESTGRGRIYSQTTIHRGPDPSWEVPYVLAIIDLDEGWSMLSRLVGSAPDETVPGSLIGLEVEVRFVPEGRHPNRTLPVFELVGSST